MAVIQADGDDGWHLGVATRNGYGKMIDDGEAGDARWQHGGVRIAWAKAREEEEDDGLWRRLCRPSDRFIMDRLL